MPEHTDNEEQLQLHPADLADQLQQMTADEAVEVLRALPRERASEVLSELDEDVSGDILAELSTGEIGELLGELPADEVADVAAELTPEQRYEVLAQLEPADSARVAELLRYEEDSAGGIMTDNFIALPADSTIEQCQALLRQFPEDEMEETTYLYVVDSAGRLVGHLRFRDLVLRRPHRLIREIMNPAVQAVRVDDDQEKVAQVFHQYHYMAVPVLESDGRLAGVVEATQVIDVIQEEMTEDMQLMVGLSGEERTYTPWDRAILRRLPWLYVNICTVFLAAVVVSVFESTIAQWTVLAVFLPIIANQGGNAGMQTLTVLVRGMALGDITPAAGRALLLKEVTIGVLNGLAVGVVVGVVGYVWKDSFALGIIVSLAMLLNMVTASLAGVLIPFGLKALRIDPAMASGIFLTAVTDMAGFFFFLSLATLALHWFA